MMDLLTGLLAPDAPKGTVLEYSSYDFKEPLAWWLTAIIISVMVLGVLFLYILERGTLGWIRRVFLVLIRSALLILVLLLIFRPVLLAEFKGERTRQIVVLLDSSMSMQQHDRRVTDEDILRVAIAKGLVPLDTKVDSGPATKAIVERLKSNNLVKDPARIDMVRWLLTHKEHLDDPKKEGKQLKLIENLAKAGPLQAWTFGSRLTSLSQEAGPLPSTLLTKLAALKDKEYGSEKNFKDELAKVLKSDDAKHEARIVRAAGDKFKLTQQGFDLLGSTDVNEQLLANLAATEEKTYLYNSVSSILQRKEGDLPGAIFIITDGQDNADKLTLVDVKNLCQRFRVPLYIYGVGSAQAASLRLKEVNIPDTLFVKDTARIPLSWKSGGIKKGNVEIALQIAKKDPATGKWGDYEPVKIKDKDNKDLDKKKLPVEEGFDLREELIFPVREKPGLKPDEIQDEVQKIKVTMELVDNPQFMFPPGPKNAKAKPMFSQDVEREVRVTNRKIKVLVIQNYPTHEFRFLQTALDPERERRFDTTYYLASANEKVTRDNILATPEEISKKPFISYLDKFKRTKNGAWEPMTRKDFFDLKYDVIVLGDIGPEMREPQEVAVLPEKERKIAEKQLSKQYMEWIKEYVEKFRGGLIVLAGPHNMPANFKNTPLAEVLPVEFEPKTFNLATTERSAEYLPTLTDAGQRTDMLFLADSPEENLKIWKEQLPGFYWQYPLTSLRAGATALVVNPSPNARMGDRAMPVIATQFYGKGQVFFCGTDESWRWRKDVGDKYFVRYWGQLLYQMGLPHLLGDGSKRVVFSQDQSEMSLGKQSYLYVRVFDKDFNPRKDVQIEATLEQIEGDKGPKASRQPVVFRQVVGSDGKPLEGQYKVLLANKEKGRFQIKLANVDENGQMQQHAFQYYVEPPPKDEMEEVGLAEKELRDLAKDSGGKFYREEDLHHLASDLQERKVDYRIRQEVVLWNPLAMLLFIVLITAEWLIRKFSNLS